MLRSLFTCCVFVLPFVLCAQDDAVHDPEPAQRTHVFRYNYDNDFFNATDYYYTQGIRIEYGDLKFKKIPVYRLLPKLRVGEDEEFSLSLNQQCFTPTSIRDDIIRDRDRPFAGTMFLGFLRSSVNESKKLRLLSELDLGAVGPCAGCRETQGSIHTWLDNVFPHGWQFQVGNSFVINASAKLEKGLLETEHFDFSGDISAQAGALHTRAGLGLTARAGWMRPKFQLSKRKNFQAYIFGRSETIAVGYNATMQGGPFSRFDAYTIAGKDVERFLLRADAGIILSYKKLQVEFTRTYLTPEFRLGREHSWGHCVVSVYF